MPRENSHKPGKKFFTAVFTANFGREKKDNKPFPAKNKIGSDT